MVTLTKKEVKLLQKLDIGMFVDKYETQWSNGIITDKELEAYSKIFTKLGYEVD
tara:strand:- start:27 stop:188 length:162 start_codon:yes stop_codon:yes gene_type:complete